MSSTNPVGTIAFILDEEALLVRVNKGWQYIAVRTQIIFIAKGLLNQNPFLAWYFIAASDPAHDNNLRISIVRP